MNSEEGTIMQAQLDRRYQGSKVYPSFTDQGDPKSELRAACELGRIPGP